MIPIYERIGLFDRKMRIVNENCDNDEDWLKWSLRALKSVFGYEFQGDSVLIARENLLYDYMDYYNNDELLKLDEIDASKFNELKDIIGASKASKKKKEVVVNGQGLTDEQVEHIDDPEPPATPDPLTPEEIAERQKKKQATFGM